MKTSRELIAEIRAVAHRDIDAIFDALPHLLDHADAPHRDRPKLSAVDAERLTDPDDHRVDPALIRATGGHSDPTSAAATKPDPAREWIKRTRAAVRQLHTLSAQVGAQVGEREPVIGPPVCLNCRKEIRHDQRTRRRNAQLEHERCAPWQRQLPDAA